MSDGDRMTLEGKVVIVQADTDPGDMGEPRTVKDGDTTVVVVPSFNLWPKEGVPLNLLALVRRMLATPKDQPGLLADRLNDVSVALWEHDKGELNAGRAVALPGVAPDISQSPEVRAKAMQAAIETGMLPCPGCGVYGAHAFGCPYDQ